MPTEFLTCPLHGRYPSHAGIRSCCVCDVLKIPIEERMMRRAELSDKELKERLMAEKVHFKTLDEKKELYKQNLVWGSKTIQDYELLKAQWKDSAAEIAHLYKKIHPYFPVGQCAICGSVTSKVVGSGRKHYVCIACGHEAVE